MKELVRRINKTIKCKCCDKDSNYENKSCFNIGDLWIKQGGK